MPAASAGTKTSSSVTAISRLLVSSTSTFSSGNYHTWLQYITRGVPGKTGSTVSAEHKI